MNTTFYLARHGETRWNKEQRFQGQLDSELTLLGKQQSLGIAEKLLDKSIDLIISSALGRAVATAKLCQQKLKVKTVIDDNLSERNLGVWQGQQLASLKSETDYDEMLHKLTDIAPIGGESALNCGKRVFNTMLALAKQSPNTNMLVIFHGEALRCFLLLLGERCKGNAYRLFENGCIWELSYEHSTAEFTYRLL